MWSEPNTPQPHASSKLPKFILGGRVVTLIALGISLGIKKNNSQPWDNSDYQIGSYKYMTASLFVGLAYTLLQIPFATYFAVRGKRLITQSIFLLGELYGDKVLVCILGTGVGAAFGVTADFKDILSKGGYDNKALDSYFNMAYISAGFLLIGLISSAISSALSTLPISGDVED